jgi:fluoride exporter
VAGFSWRHLGLVVVGGVVGTAARAALLLIDTPGWQPLAVPVVNVAGGFALGLLTGVLSRRAATPASQNLRQLLGTGVLGGFTTYSTFAVQAVDGAGIALTVGTALVGLAAALAGLLLGARRSAA